MNYHSNEWIMAGVKKHYDEILKHYKQEQIVFIFYTGAANYNADWEYSDIDTWAIIIDDEYQEGQYQIDLLDLGEDKIFICDIRAYINGLYNSDWAYLPGLYSKYTIVNPRYQEFIDMLINHREQFAYSQVANSFKEAAKIFNFHSDKTLPEAMDTRPRSKRLYYCALILLHMYTHKHKLPYSSMFYNDIYGKQLQFIKSENYSYTQCRQILKMMAQQAVQLQPTVYDNFSSCAELIALSDTIKIQIMEKYKDGHPN